MEVNTDKTKKELVERYQEVLQRLRKWIESNTGPNLQNIEFKAPIFHDDSLDNLWTQRTPDGFIKIELKGYFSSSLTLEKLRQGTLQETQNRVWDLPRWAPVHERLYLESKVLIVKSIIVDDAVRHAGLGRQCLNVLQQALTRQTVYPMAQSLVLDLCHFPLFYTADSQYGWLPTSDGPVRTYPPLRHVPPAMVFQRYWIYKRVLFPLICFLCN